jgi:hypothetical protein
MRVGAFSVNAIAAIFLKKVFLAVNAELPSYTSRQNVGILVCWVQGHGLV